MIMLAQVTSIGSSSTIQGVVVTCAAFARPTVPISRTVEQGQAEKTQLSSG